MPKILRQNVGGVDYTMAGCALSGSCVTAASDFVKVVTLSDGDTVSEGMTIVVAFANGNTAGNAPIPMAIYSSDQVHYFSDSGLTQPFTLAPAGCYTITYTGTGNAYDYISYPVLQVGSVSGPLCDASGKEASGSLWLAGDKVSINYANGCFSVIPQTTSFLAVMAASSVVNGAPVRIGGTLRVLFTQDLAGSANAGLVLTYNGADVPVMVGKNGSLSALLPFDVGGGTYKYLQAYTTLELMYDGTQFIIIGNPVVLSGTDYTIYADGLQRVNTVAVGNKGMVTSGGVASAINSLDVPSVGGSGKYISAISETDGKISATAGDITSTVSSGNSQPVTSGGAFNILKNQKTYEFFTPDYTRYVLMQDISTWYNSTSSSVLQSWSMNGMLVAQRMNGNDRSETVNLTLSVGYFRNNQSLPNYHIMNVNSFCLNNFIQACIVRYNSKEYLALKILEDQARTYYFIGYCTSTPIFTNINREQTVTELFNSGRTITNEVTQNSPNLITSGAVYTKLLDFISKDKLPYTTLTSGQNINNLKTEGVYQAEYDAIGNSLIGRPNESIDSSFLFVMIPKNNAVVQIIISCGTGNIYVRQANTLQSDWKDWHKLSYTTIAPTT